MSDLKVHNATFMKKEKVEKKIEICYDSRMDFSVQIFSSYQHTKVYSIFRYNI